MLRHVLKSLPGLVVVAMMIQPSQANPNLKGGQEIEATVSSVSDSSVVLQTAGGTETYAVDSDALAALGLASGDSVILDTTRLETGTITGLDPYTVKVALDNGDTRSFVLDREGRRYLTYGDRIVITPKDFPSRCQRLYRLDNYELKGGDLRKVVVYVASVPAPAPAPAPAPIPDPIPAPAVIPAPTVPGLW